MSSQKWKIENILDGIFIPSPGSCLRGQTWGYQGVLGGPKKFFSRNSTRFGVWVTYINGTCNSTIFLGPRLLGPWGVAKRSNIIKSQITKSISKIFKLNFVCLLANERCKTYKTGFSFDPWVMHAPGFGTWWCWGVKNLIFWTWSCGISN